MGEQVRVEFKVKNVKLFERSLPEHRWRYGQLPPVPVQKVKRDWRLKEPAGSANL